MKKNKALFTFIKIAFKIMVVLLVIYAGVSLCRIAYDYGYRLYTEPAMEEEPGEDVLVQVTSDMSNWEIAGMLQERGLVRDKGLFFVQLTLSDYRNEIEPGIYTLNTSMEADELIAEMATRDETEESTEESTEEESAETEET